MQTAMPWTWAYWIGAGTLGLLGIGLLIWSLFWDRARSRERCPRCWYDMSGTAPHGLTCPECGRDAKRERRLYRTRRRWGFACIAIFLITGAAALWATPFIRRDGWYRHAPTTALIAVVLYDDNRPRDPDILLLIRFRDTHVWGWQKRWLARGCTSRLQAATAPGQKQALMMMLGAVGPSAVGAAPVVSSLRNDDDEITRLFAWSALSRVGLRDQATVSLINGMLSDPDSDYTIRQRVVNRLGDSGAAAAGAVPAIIQVINRPELHAANGGFIIGGAAQTLGQIGPDAAAALPTLRRLAEDPNIKIDQRYTALAAIALITRDASSGLAFHLRMLKNPDRELRAIALSYFLDWDIARNGVTAIPALLEVMGDEEPSFRSGAQFALGVMLAEDKRAKRVLERIARRADSPLRERAAKVLEAGPQTTAVGFSLPPPSPLIPPPAPTTK